MTSGDYEMLEGFHVDDQAAEAREREKALAARLDYGDGLPPVIAADGRENGARHVNESGVE